MKCRDFLNLRITRVYHIINVYLVLVQALQHFLQTQNVYAPPFMCLHLRLALVCLIPTPLFSVFFRFYQARRQRGAAGLYSPHITLLKTTDFVDTMITNVLRDLPFSRNQPLKSADDWYIGILKNKTRNSASLKRT
jgi:hypothetical protein